MRETQLSYQFQQRAITIERNYKQVEVQGVVAKGTGLAYVYDDDKEVYGLYHLASHKLLLQGVTERAVAQQWLELVASLTDWTQDATAIRTLGWTIPQQILDLREQAYKEVEHACHTLLALLLTPQEVQTWEGAALNDGYASWELVAVALHALLNGKVPY